MDKVQLYVDGTIKIREFEENSAEYSLWFDKLDDLWYAMNNEERRIAEEKARASYEENQEN